MEDLRQDSQTGLPKEYFALCSKHLKHRVSAEVCLLGHQWISRGFTLRKIQYHQYTRSQKIHWTLITQEMRKACKSIFSRERFFENFFGTLPRNFSIQNSIPKKHRFLFRLGRPIRNMLSIFQDDKSTTLSNRMGLF